MVNKTLKEINRIAKLQHATLQGKIATPTEQESDVRLQSYFHSENPSQVFYT